MDGYNYDLELHVVHSYSDGLSGKAVIGIFFDREKGGHGRNTFLDQILPVLQTPGPQNLTGQKLYF